MIHDCERTSALVCQHPDRISGTGDRDIGNRDRVEYISGERQGVLIAEYELLKNHRTVPGWHKGYHQKAWVAESQTR